MASITGTLVYRDGSVVLCVGNCTDITRCLNAMQPVIKTKGKCICTEILLPLFCVYGCFTTSHMTATNICKTMSIYP